MMKSAVMISPQDIVEAVVEATQKVLAQEVPLMLHLPHKNP
jgi:hypothetical protein